MNPGEKQSKTKFGTPTVSLVHAFPAIPFEAPEPMTTKMLVACLLTAFAVNVACLLGHL